MAMQVPEVCEMSEGWSAFSMDVPSIKTTLAPYEKNGQEISDIYEYKLPYVIADVPCCARINPALYCCDVYCCCCLKSCIKTKPTFMDMVNQVDGHQVRYRSQKLCCRVPKVMTFIDGQYIGHLSRTMRCGNRCLSCIEDVKGQPVLQVAVHNNKGEQVARIEREGKGCCCICKPACPCKCVNGCFYCLNCTCICQPSTWNPCCGLLDCDPVCCDGCIRGQTQVCACKDCNMCCIGLPAACCLCCCCPTCETRAFKTTSTVHYDEVDVVSAEKDREKRHSIGRMQSHFRGNAPSSYMHDADTPLAIKGVAKTKELGAMLAGVAAGVVYKMGMAAPPFEGLQPRPAGRSPGFDGWVHTPWASDARELVEVLGDDCVVTEPCVVGKKYGCQVRGWRLIELGYHVSPLSCCGIGCGGEVFPPKYIKSAQQAKDLVKLALENRSGEMQVTFSFRFQLPEQEKEIVHKGENFFGDVSQLDKKFNPPRGGYAQQLEEIAVACSCVRFYKFPCNCTIKKKICCRCPLYARPITRIAPQDADELKGGKPKAPAMMVGAPKQAWMAD